MSIDPRRSMLDVLDAPGVVRVHAHDYDAQGVAPPWKRATCSARAERALVLARPGDVVLLNQPADPDFLAYLGRLGVGARRDAVIPLAADFHTQGLVARDALGALGSDAEFADLVAARVVEWLDASAQPRLIAYYSAGFMEPLRASLERRLGRPVNIEDGGTAPAALANDKGLMRAAAERLGIPVARGGLVSGSEGKALEDVVVEAARRCCESNGGAIVRGAWSSAGADVTVVRDPFDALQLRQWLAGRSGQRGYLVEEVFPFTSAPNILCWVHGDGTPSLVAVTNQRLLPSGAHGGNVYPWTSATSAAMTEATLRLAGALAEQGFRGPVGVDLLEGPGPDGMEYRFVEVNGRMNASTYGQALFDAINRQRLERGLPDLPVWQSRGDLAVQVSGFAELADRLGALLYDHGTAGGVCPFNTGLIPHGRVDLLVVAATREAADEIEARALETIQLQAA